jgi:hypothetical protein
MKDVCHGSLESCAGIFEAEGHDTVCKCTPGGYECGFVLIGWVNLDLVVAREVVHKGESFMAGAIIDNLIDERRWEVSFGQALLRSRKSVQTQMVPCFLSTGTGLETHEV